MNDKDWRPWMNAAIIYRQLQRNDRAEAAYARALPLLEAAVKLQPRDASLQSQLAAVYAYSGEREKSISRIEATLALSPDSALDLLRIADAWAALGNRDRAVETANLAVRKGMTRDQLDADPESRRFRSDSRFNRPTR
jgi:Flp pilus assembly protein TadD